MGQRRDRLYSPRTPHDYSTIDRLVLEGASDQEIFRILASPLWRSELYQRNGIWLCSRCDQVITIELCEECGLPLSERRERRIRRAG